MNILRSILKSINSLFSRSPKVKYFVGPKTEFLTEDPETIFNRHLQEKTP